MRLDLADLRLFIAIVDTGSITGGAAAAPGGTPATGTRPAQALWWEPSRRSDTPARVGP